MATVIRELTAQRLADVDDAIGDIGAWWDDQYRCDAASAYPSVSELRSKLDDPNSTERVLVAFDNVANKVYGLASFRPAPNSLRVRWLVARPAVFGQVASALCGAVAARVPNVPIWGCVSRDVQRARFTATGNFVVVNHADVPVAHVIRNYPDGHCIRYTG